MPIRSEQGVGAASWERPGFGPWSNRIVQLNNWLLSVPPKFPSDWRVLLAAGRARVAAGL